LEAAVKQVELLLLSGEREKVRSVVHVTHARVRTQLHRDG
jgi:hypothetical protein